MTNGDDRSSFGGALGLGLALSILAAIAAILTESSGFLSTLPPIGQDAQTPTADVGEDDRFKLYFAAFSAWAALMLFVPAVVRFCQSGSSEAWRFWWTASYIAFLIHMAWTVLVFFGGNLEAVMNSTRVSAPIPGFLLLLWWGLDVILAWSQTTGKLISIQRVILHVGAFILFIGGSAATGETVLIKIIGIVAALIMIAALVKGLMLNKKTNV